MESVETCSVDSELENSALSVWNRRIDQVNKVKGRVAYNMTKIVDGDQEIRPTVEIQRLESAPPKSFGSSLEVSETKSKVTPKNTIKAEDVECYQVSVVQRSQSAQPRNATSPTKVNDYAQVPDKSAYEEDCKKIITFKDSNDEWLSVRKDKLLVIVVFLLICNIFYGVLLHVTLRAAQCQLTLDSIIEKRRELHKQIMKSLESKH